jgi:hypothetical protein
VRYDASKSRGYPNETRRVCCQTRLMCATTRSFSLVSLISHLGLELCLDFYIVPFEHCYRFSCFAFAFFWPRLPRHSVIFRLLRLLRLLLSLFIVPAPRVGSSFPSPPYIFVPCSFVPAVDHSADDHLIPTAIAVSYSHRAARRLCCAVDAVVSRCWLCR